MNIISKIEKKFGRYSIRNLTLYLIIGYGIGYLLFMFQPKILFMLTLDPAAVMHGQVWRLFTWIITPPVFGVDIFTIICRYFTTVWDLCWNVLSEHSFIICTCSAPCCLP